MQLKRFLWFATIAGAGLIASRAQNADAGPAGTTAAPTEIATHDFIAHVLLPLWMLPGLGDYLCHKEAVIEQTSGTHESLTHILMISLTGAGVLTGLFFEVDESALAVMAISALLHEAVVLWDVGYAQTHRPPTPTEQHMHSFLEVLPFTALASMCCLHPAATASLLREPLAKRSFRLTPKRQKESPVFIGAVLLMGALALGIPYAEEFIRCFNVDRTLLPRR